MKTRTFLILVLCACCVSFEVLAQAKLDSLLQVLKTAKEDTSKVNTLNSLGAEYQNAGDNDLSREYCDKALLLSEKLQFEKGKVRAYIIYGQTYFYEGFYPEALNKYNKALSISEKLKDKKFIATSYNYIGLTYTYQRNYSEGLKMQQRALKYQQEVADSTGMGRSYNYLGIIYEEQANFTEAIKAYLALLKIAEARGNKTQIASANFNLGNVSTLQENHAEANKYHALALKYYQEIGSKQNIGLCYTTMADSYQILDSVELSMEYSQRAYELFEEIGNRLNAAQAKALNANANTRLGNYSQAQDGFDYALNIFNEIGDTFNLAAIYRGIGELHLRKEEYDEALKYFKTGLEMAKATGYTTTVVYLYGVIARTYEKKNDYKNAYLNHTLYFTYNDSVLNEAKSEQTAEMKVRYETEKKDNEIVLLNKDKTIRDIEIKKQKLLKYSFIGGFGLVIMLLLLSYRTYRIRQSLRLQDIRNKIAGDLHDDIGSTLNSISIYSEVARRKDGQQDEALEMIGDASRKIIDAMSDIVWAVNPENDSFAKIIFRMKSIAYNLFRAKQIEFTFHADEFLNDKKLSLEVRRNFYLIFKEAVNNLVKYSNATRSAITLTSENNSIKLRIKDDGVGFDTSDEVIGNGLKNMKRRADEMKAQFRIESSKGNGTQIELILKS